MNAKTLVKPETDRSAAGLPKKQAASLNMAEQLEGLIDSVVDKLMPPKGAGRAGMGVVHSRQVYRADAIAMLIAASHHMADPSVKEDRLILALLLEAQKAAAN